METLAEKIKQRFTELRNDRIGWETLWQQIAAYVMPRRYPGIQGTVTSPNVETEELLYDTTAVQGNMTLANGQLSWMSPMESPWYSFEPEDRKNDEAKRWLADATDKARQVMAVSTFYEAAHEFYLDRGAFGTAALYCGPGRKGPLHFRIWPVGTFVIAEDDEGNVDTVIREFNLTPRQAVQKFGIGNVHPITRKKVEANKAEANKPEKYLHIIYPREDAERDRMKLGQMNMPHASVYLDFDNCHVCGQGGYEEFPVFVSRYLEWGSGLGGLYGWSPAFTALPEARQLNFLQKMLDALAEKMAFPPVLAPEELEGEIDANAFGVTYFSRDLQGQLPKEWMTQGRYDIGLDRVRERKQSVNDAFHVDLFQMFATLDKQMTAREVAERSQEKLIQFSPTFARLTTEFFNPLLERVFGMLLRAGKLGDPPASLIQDLGNGQGFVAPPKIVYSSRIALAMKALPAIGYNRAIERLAVVAQMQPSIIDNLDLDFAERETALSDGVPADYVRSKSDVEDIRKARAEAEAEIRQQEQAMMAAQAAAQLGRVPAESPIGAEIGNQIAEQR